MVKRPARQNWEAAERFASRALRSYESSKVDEGRWYGRRCPKLDGSGRMDQRLPPFLPPSWFQWNPWGPGSDVFMGDFPRKVRIQWVISPKLFSWDILGLLNLLTSITNFQRDILVVSMGI